MKNSYIHKKHQTLFVIRNKIIRKLYYKDLNTDSCLLAHSNACARKIPSCGMQVAC